jgi:pimeloyl-ACP methyl ester carboxylesterase
LAIREISIDNKKFKIAYDLINIDKKQNIIFLHGWGSNKEIMKIFKDSFKEFKHIYIDMPGFGKSSNNYVLTTQEYAKIINQFLKELNINKDIIIGHSFGGKVATLLKPDLLVLLASAGIIEEKPLSVKIKIKIYKFLKMIRLSKFRKYFISKDVNNMNENMYMTFKNVVDEDFSSTFKNYKGDVLIFGAKEDRAVSPQSIKKQGELLKKETIMLDGGHYFFFNSPNKIKAKENRKIIEEKILKR